jgi:hypothetical protein
MHKYTLVVVDMQPFFEDANDERTIANVEREIRRAIDRGCDILFTEIPYFSPMDEEGLKPTHRRLRDLVNGYKQAYTINKMMFPRGPYEGARCVLNGCDYRGFNRKRFRICGVCTGGWHRNKDGSIQVDERTGEQCLTGCVFDITVGLTRLAPEARIKVVQDACRDTRPMGDNGNRWIVNWDDYRSLPNVKVVSPDEKTRAEDAA